MFRVPVTYYYNFDRCTDQMRPLVMDEFAHCGAENLVLSDYLIDMMIQKDRFMFAVEKEMADAGLKFVDAHAPFGPVFDMNCVFKGFRKIMMSKLKTVLDICSYFKVDTITIHVGNNHYDPAYSIPEKDHFAAQKETLAELLPYAEKLGITICIENIWFSINTPEALLDLKKEFPSDALGFCYDSGHANIMDKGRKFKDSARVWGEWQIAGYEEPEWEDKALEKMLPHIVNCHLHDNFGNRDAHDLPGKGDVDWQHVVEMLNAAPRLKVIQSEVAPVVNGISIRDLCGKFDELFRQD